MKRVSIIIPAYNEEKRIKTTLEGYVRSFSGKLDYEIIVVTDGCTDKTVEILKDISRRLPEIRNIDFSERLGKGGAILKGFKAAKGNLIAYVDADGATPGEGIIDLINKINGFDGVIGSRWMSGSIVSKKQPLLRRMASRILNYMIRLLLGMKYKDTQCGAKVFRENAI